MALWAQVSQELQNLPTQTLNKLYPDTFPLDLRHYLASWLEGQRWENFDVDNVEQEPQARLLWEQMVHLLQEVAKQNNHVVEKVKLQRLTRNLSVFKAQPLQLVKTVRDILRKERKLLGMQPTFPQLQPMTPGSPAASGPLQPPRDDGTDVNILGLKVLEIQNCRQHLHHLQEDLNWEKQEAESVSGQNDLDPQHPDKLAQQKRIQQLENSYSLSAEKRLQLLQETVCSLEQSQSCLLNRIKTWRWEQHRASIGLHITDNLRHLQTWCEQLLKVNSSLKQEIMLMRSCHGEMEQSHALQERLRRLFLTLVQSSLVVDKQPPQVIKTQSKFSTTVRYLLGEMIAPGKPVLLKAQIITETQARMLSQHDLIPKNVSVGEVGEIINSTSILEHNNDSRSTCATFKNMSIRKIRRADRKGAESVTEEKFALLFTTDISITGCEKPCAIQTVSLPVVVIVHGSQEINAMATIVWDCAFSEPNRIPFVVPDSVSWKQMCEALNSKFMSEVQTQRGLDRYNLLFLAQKIFDQQDISEDFSNMMVSWTQFNKDVLPGRSFTFWQWFEGVIYLTKKCLKEYWSEGLIFGFIGKQHIHVILNNKPPGTFLLRFSDSEIGGITIAYVGPRDSCKILNVQPFTKKDLDSAGLGDRIQDITSITHVYPDLPKNDVFKKFFTVLSAPRPNGYLPFKLTTVVNTGEQCPPAHNIPPQRDFPPDLSVLHPFPNINQDIYSMHPTHCTPSYMTEHHMSVQAAMFQPSILSNPPNEPMNIDAINGLLSSF